MEIDELVFFGTISKPFSFRGQLIVYSDFDIIKSKTIFIKIEDSYIPFKLKSSTPYKNKLFKFSLFNIDDENKAKSLVKKEVYIKKDELEKNDNDLDFLVSFNLYNKKKFVGPIIATVKKVGQDLIVVDYNNKNILIPFAKDLICDIDKKNQILIMNLPTGLLEI